MPAKDLVFDEEARGKLRAGVDTLANVLGSTLGPKGRNVMLQKYSNPEVSNDGQTIAKEIDALEDIHEDVGMRILKEAAIKTGDKVGDGTTSSVVLAQAFVQAGLKGVAAGSNPMFLKRGVELAVAAAVGRIRENSRSVENSDDITKVATIAASDADIGSAVGEVMDRVGKDGIAIVDESRTGFPLLTRYVEGMQLDKGWLSPYFVTNSDRMEGELENPLVLLTDQNITTGKDFMPMLDKIAASGNRNLFLIASNLTEDALALVIVNKLRGVLNTVAIKAPSYGDRMRAILGDVAVLTGARVVSEDMGVTWENVPLEWLGTCNRVNVNKEASVLIEGGGSEADVLDRTKQIREQMESVDSDWDHEKLEERLARLSGGVGVIEVGAPTDVELREKKARAEDAVHTTRAAVSEGIVPGGGVAYLRAADAIEAIESDLEGDTLIGARMVKAALQAPIRKIVSNAGENGSIIVDRILSNDDLWYGFDADRGEYGDLYELGVVDAANVCVIALQNAASVANMLMTTDVVLNEIPLPPAPVSPEQMEAMGGGGMGGMGGGGMGGMGGGGMGGMGGGGMGGMGGMPGMM